MPKGPEGQKRPADVIANAVRVLQIVTGEIEEEAPKEGAGDTWTWTALEAETKLLVSWLVGGRDSEYRRGWP